MRVPPSPCVVCHKMMDAADEVNDPTAIPVPGDPTFCCYCGELHVFGPDMRLRLMTEDEFMSFPLDHREYFSKIQLAVRRARVVLFLRDLEDIVND